MSPDPPRRAYKHGAVRVVRTGPLGGDIQNPQSLNRYAYVLNNPETFIDPTGQSCQQVFMIGVGNIVDCTTYYFTGEGGLKEALFSFFSEATGMNGCVLGWCTPTPPPDTIAYTIASTLEKRLRSALRYAAERPVVLSWILPIEPLPVLGGVGPAGSLSWNPKTGTVCVAAGLGVSAGHEATIGPITNDQPLPEGTPASPEQVDSVLSGWSLSFGYNLPTGAAGPGFQSILNGSGALEGPTVGVPGLSGATTYAACSKT